MKAKPLQAKTIISKPVRTKYGPTCPECGLVNAEGADDITPNVDINTFREILRRRGYPKRTIVCDNPKCRHMFDARLDRVNFGQRDETVPTQDTFF